MAFKRSEIDQLLARCHRRCCICHRFCGTKMETDHIVPRAEGGDDSIGNAIPVCFECHAEIHGYNPDHPRGRRFRPGELRQHKQQWLKTCERNPEALVAAARQVEVGPLQALIDELEFNERVATSGEPIEIGCRFETDQFRRAMACGAFTLLSAGLRTRIHDAYVATGNANELLAAAWHHPKGSTAWSNAINKAIDWIAKAKSVVPEARRQLLAFLSTEGEEDAT